jgi:hypothetical protein
MNESRISSELSLYDMHLQFYILINTFYVLMQPKHLGLLGFSMFVLWELIPTTLVLVYFRNIPATGAGCFRNSPFWNGVCCYE